MQTEFLCKQNTREDPKLLLESYFLFCGLVFSLITTAEKNFEHLCWKTIQVVTHSVDKTQVPKTTLNFAKKLVFLFFFFSYSKYLVAFLLTENGYKMSAFLGFMNKSSLHLVIIILKNVASSDKLFFGKHFFSNTNALPPNT